MRATQLRLTAVAVAAGLVACGSERQEPVSPVTVSPASPAGADLVRVRARTLFGRGERGDGSNYHFTLTGPAGPRCRGRFESAAGMPAWANAPNSAGR